MTTLTQGCLRFAAAVARHAGRRGVEATVWVALGAVLEGVGVLLLVPLLATLFDADLGGALSAPAAMIARFAPDLPPITRLGLILALFAGLMILRNLVLCVATSCPANCRSGSSRPCAATSPDASPRHAGRPWRAWGAAALPM